jgi:hypothetical protein
MGVNEDTRDQISYWLDNGWSVVGYDTQLLALGNVTHFVLLQKEYALRSVAIVFDKQRVMGTNVFELAPGEAKQ